jgi:hypothetical protein
MASEVGRRKAAAMLIKLRIRLTIEKSAKDLRSPLSKAWESAQLISKQNQL